MATPLICLKISPENVKQLRAALSNFRLSPEILTKSNLSNFVRWKVLGNYYQIQYELAPLILRAAVENWRLQPFWLDSKLLQVLKLPKIVQL